MKTGLVSVITIVESAPFILYTISEKLHWESSRAYKTWPQIYKTLLMLILTEHEIYQQDNYNI